MIENKRITIIVAVLMTVTVIACLCLILLPEGMLSSEDNAGVTMEYESKLFDTSEVLEVNILMEDAEWEALLANAINEEYMQCDVEIGGKIFYNVGIRPKGNTSLSTIVMDPDTDRYSLKLEFDQYVDGQTCFGLDKLILNNSYADATYMKEALIYDMFQEMNVDASLYNYAKVSVNGEYRGLYLALEGVEDSFMLRNYGTSNGELYKPDSMEMGGGENGFGVGMSGGGMFGGGGANLNYSDDDLDSYSTIWNGEVTNTGNGDHERVIEALKNISEGNQLEQYMDVENLVKYMAVHIFSENEDSLSGSMAHNYYLYESDGRLNILPWDYNLAFGGMSMGRSSGATDVVNGAIDDAWNGTGFFDTLLENEEYRQAYYEAMELVVDYVQNGGFEEFYTNTRDKIDGLVETDPTAFYTYEEYLTAADTLYEVVTLRGQSVEGQLAGDIPSTESEQRNSQALIDASRIDLSVMGSMSMGGGSFGFGDRNEEGRENMREDTTRDDAMWQNIPQDMAMPEDGFEMPEGMELPEDFTESQTFQPGSRDFGSQGGNNLEAVITYGICFVVLAAAFLFALLYRRKPRKR